MSLTPRSYRSPGLRQERWVPDDNLHAPNEKFRTPNFYRGIESIIRFLEKLGA
jgi:acetylornithine deacetylase/succinyl-diaminopimelate desuccinylase-like protein